MSIFKNDINIKVKINIMDISYLEGLKKTVEKLDKHHQVEILKILIKNDTKINENKSGIFINMSTLEKSIIEEMEKYIEYIKEQETNLNKTESQKQEFRNTYFNVKEDKENITFTSSTAYGSHI
tara:strand:+ start:1037 stop:1408 length:372 start_codon:yes stop_codon:yes gene_type:complete